MRVELAEHSIDGILNLTVDADGIYIIKIGKHGGHTQLTHGVVDMTHIDLLLG